MGGLSKEDVVPMDAAVGNPISGSEIWSGRGGQRRDAADRRIVSVDTADRRHRPRDRTSGDRSGQCGWCRGIWTLPSGFLGGVGRRGWWFGAGEAGSVLGGTEREGGGMKAEDSGCRS